MMLKETSPKTHADITKTITAGCPKTQDAGAIDDIFGQLMEHVMYLPSTNYAHESKMKTQIPGHPLKYICKELTKSMKDDPKYKKMSKNPENLPKGGFKVQQTLTQRQNDLFKGLNTFINIMTNYTGEKHCTKPGEAAPPTVIDNNGWYSLTCTELGMPNLYGKGSIFPFDEKLTHYDYKSFSDSCMQNRKKRPDFDFIMKEFGGYNPKEDFKEYSNIAFMNGALD